MKRLLGVFCVVEFILSLTQVPLFCETANAHFLSGNRLLSICDADRGVASLVIEGIVDGLEPFVSVAAKKPLECLRPGVTGGQLTDEVCAYLRTHPKYRDTPASSHVLAILMTDYPCK